MLRSGYSSETILRDLSARHFADRLDPAAEQQLKEANASPALLDALKSGNYAASAEESAQARQRIAEGKTAAQKFVEQQRMIAKQEAAAQHAAKYAPRNPEIVVVPMPKPLYNPTDKELAEEKRAAEQAARKAWCDAHPAECAAQEASSAAQEASSAAQQAQRELQSLKTSLFMKGITP